tara:strand:+ start:187 stop:432 length:246 start_codon:yes stop_codon:yes gene_type:complete
VRGAAAGAAHRFSFFRRGVGATLARRIDVSANHKGADFGRALRIFWRSGFVCVQTVENRMLFAVLPAFCLHIYAKNGNGCA